VHAPLVVTGIPRTGTTALHKLLSMDPQFQGLEQWLIGTPMPRPPRLAWDTNPQFRAAVANQQAFLDAVPALRVSHEVNADEVDECLNLLAQSFVSHYPATGFGLPGYDRWWWQRDETDSYRRYADNLRLIGADAPGQRWLLKPGHITHLMPCGGVSGCLRHPTHRDPAKCIPRSAASSGALFFPGANRSAEIGRGNSAVGESASARNGCGRRPERFLMSALPISVNIRWRWSAPSIGISASISATPRNGGCGTGSTPTRSTSTAATSTARRSSA
jgi:hypothetical protein